MRVKHGEIFNKKNFVVDKEEIDCFWQSTRYSMEKTFDKSNIAVVEVFANS